MDGCRIPTKESLNGGRISTTKSEGWDRPWKHDATAIAECRKRGDEAVAKAEALGRWPANLILNEEAAAMLDDQSGERKVIPHGPNSGSGIWGSAKAGYDSPCYLDKGGASRFFYCAKSSKRERGNGNNHPTVKPLKLIEYLVRLITPPNGILLDPFIGSGTTALACLSEGFHYIGFEQDKTYFKIAQKRIVAHKTSPRQLKMSVAV